jgi:cellulose synthase/poly-beta-1,6-N-acetylglucosamine synthase-like glycosyltransferase
MFDLPSLASAWNFVSNLTVWAFVEVFWFTVIFEIPRYGLGFIAATIEVVRERSQALPPLPQQPKVSILIAGHNEADALEKGVLSLKEQTFTDFEIVCVSDGSTDETYAVMRDLQNRGLVDKIAGCETRGGKSSAINLAARLASGDIVIVIDCDCSFDRNAIEEILRPFADPTVGAVSGNVMARNYRESIIATLQAIEYLITISVGKAQSGMLNQISCISGAFGAFRKSAWNRVNGMDGGPGEDMDITLRLRLAGYRIVFASRSIAFTDTPIAFWNLMRQRNRWERDSVWLRYRKYPWTLNPFRPDFRWQEALHHVDFFFFHFVAALATPIYIVYAISFFGEMAVWILISAGFALVFFDMITFTAAVIGAGKRQYWTLAPYILIYGPFQSYVMRFVRLWAYIQEWIWSTSREDSFAPPKVQAWAVWK